MKKKIEMINHKIFSIGNIRLEKYNAIYIELNHTFSTQKFFWMQKIKKFLWKWIHLNFPMFLIKTVSYRMFKKQNHRIKKKIDTHPDCLGRLKNIIVSSLLHFEHLEAMTTLSDTISLFVEQKKKNRNKLEKLFV